MRFQTPRVKPKRWPAGRSAVRIKALHERMKDGSNSGHLEKNRVRTRAGTSHTQLAAKHSFNYRSPPVLTAEQPFDVSVRKREFCALRFGTASATEPGDDAVRISFLAAVP